MIIWITGLAGSGKTTIGKRVYEKIKAKHINTVFLDGDIFRDIFNSYGYRREDRKDVAEKISKLCQYLESQDINVVCCTISLFEEIHETNRKCIEEYYEVFIDVEFDELVRRDKKGLYKDALDGKIKNVVGVDLTPDIPTNPDLIIDNNTLNNLEEKADSVLRILVNKE